MDRASSEGEWRCENTRCGFLYADNTHRCRKCNAIKPYLLPRPGASSCLNVTEDVPGATSLLYDVSPIRTSYSSGASGSWRPEAGAHAIPLQELSHGGLQDEEEITFSGGECRMVLMGKTGNGKSSTGNSIVGTERFVVGGGMASQTKRCQWHNCIRFGIKIEIVDTPGFFDTHDDDVEVQKEIICGIGFPWAARPSSGCPP